MLASALENSLSKANWLCCGSTQISTDSVLVSGTPAQKLTWVFHTFEEFWPPGRLTGQQDSLWCPQEHPHPPKMVGGRQWFSKLVLLLSHSAHRKCFQKNPQGSCSQCRACPFCTVLHTLFSYTSVQPWDWWKPSQLHYSCVQLQFWTWPPPVTPVKQAGAQGVSAVSSQTPGFTCF